MRALILAAGTASRLRPLTDNRPKCLLKVGDKCFLERAIEALLANQVNDIAIVTGFLREQIEHLVSEKFPDLGVEYIHNEQYSSTNNIYSLWLAKASVGTRDFLLLDSDILFDQALITLLLADDSPDSLALNRHPLGEEEMKVVVDANGRVTEISKTCRLDTAAGESIGIEKISAAYAQSLFKELDVMIEEEKQVNLFYEHAFERLILKGQTFKAVDTTAIFSMEIDTVEDYIEAQTKRKWM